MNKRGGISGRLRLIQLPPLDKEGARGVVGVVLYLQSITQDPFYLSLIRGEEQKASTV